MTGELPGCQRVVSGIVLTSEGISEDERLYCRETRMTRIRGRGRGGGGECGRGGRGGG